MNDKNDDDDGIPKTSYNEGLGDITLREEIFAKHFFAEFIFHFFTRKNWFSLCFAYKWRSRLYKMMLYHKSALSN